MTPTTIAIVAGAILLGVGLLALVAIAIAAFAFTSTGDISLPSHRWRALKKDADEKFRRRQLEEDYRTVLNGAGYDVEE